MISIKWKLIRAVASGTNQHGAHAKIGRDDKIARIVFEHRGPRRIEPRLFKHALIGTKVGLWLKANFFNPEDRVEPRQAPPFKDARGIAGIGIGVDDLATRQGVDRVTEVGIGAQGGKVDVMDFVQIGHGLNPMFDHQPGERRPVFAPVMAAEPVCFGFVDAQFAHDIVDHPPFNLREKFDIRRIESVIEVEDPRRHMREIHASAYPGLSRLAIRGPKDDRLAMKDAYSLILSAIDSGTFRPGDRLVESELAERFGVSRTPVREALQRLETQSMLKRDGRSLMVATLDHNQLAELYTVRAELEALAARLAARHATHEEIRVLAGMVEDDRAVIDDPQALARANRRFHHQIHLASHNRYLVQQLDLVHRSMALMARTTLAAQGRGKAALEEHGALVEAIGSGDAVASEAALRRHISNAYETRLREEARMQADRPATGIDNEV